MRKLLYFGTIGRMPGEQTQPTKMQPTLPLCRAVGQFLTHDSELVILKKLITETTRSMLLHHTSSRHEVVLCSPFVGTCRGFHFCLWWIHPSFCFFAIGKTETM
jgi:hypothetical protein